MTAQMPKNDVIGELQNMRTRRTTTQMTVHVAPFWNQLVISFSNVSSGLSEGSTNTGGLGRLTSAGGDGASKARGGTPCPASCAFATP